MDTMRLQGPDYDRIRSGDPDFLASYANYYLCNGAVVCAHFGDQRADAAVKTTLARLYPDRAIEQLNIDRPEAVAGVSAPAHGLPSPAQAPDRCGERSARHRRAVEKVAKAGLNRSILDAGWGCSWASSRRRLKAPLVY